MREKEDNHLTKLENLADIIKGTRNKKLKDAFLDYVISLNSMLRDLSDLESEVNSYGILFQTLQSVKIDTKMDNEEGGSFVRQ